MHMFLGERFAWEHFLKRKTISKSVTLFGKVESKHEILSSEGSVKNALIKETT